MAEIVKTDRRPYSSDRRLAGAQRTRRAILDAAIRLFTKNGYASTTLQSIAGDAGVSVQTIYATLKNKRAILTEALDLAIGGDDEPMAVNERDWMQGVWHGETAELRLHAYADAVTRIMMSAGDVFLVVSAAAAADAELADLETETQRRRRLGAERVIEAVVEVADLAPGVTAQQAADILSLLNSPTVFSHLVRSANWPVEDYTQWLGRAFVRELLGMSGSERRT